MEEKTASALRPVPTRLFLLVFAALAIGLGAGYYFFLRTDYSVLYSDLRSADAAAVVAELDRRGIAYQLRDGGSTIAVPAGAAATARLAIAGSDVPSRGAVGFELFNESDMGLTDFAQRINYQRALQGELSRTIMMMSGVESARVHLALPERSLFRGNRSEPKAAVTVTSAGGGTVDAARVAGIQRLVAAAVPDLSLDDVVVLDQLGRIISPAAAEALVPPDIEEHEAVQHYFRGRARAAVENVLPNTRFDLRVLVLNEDDAGPGAAWSEDIPAAAAAAAAAPADGAPRNFRLRVVVVTESALSAADRQLIRSAIAGAVELDERSGDGVLFSVAPLPGSAAAPAASGLRPADALERAAAPLPAPSRWPGWWPWPAAMAALLAGILWLRARRRGMSPEQRRDFVQRVRTELRLAEEGGDARA